MKVSTNRPAFQATPTWQPQIAHRALPHMTHQDTIHFRGSSTPPANTDNSTSNAKPGQTKPGIGHKLFGSALKNVGWSVGWYAAGGAAFFCLPLMPFVGMGLMGVGALHLIAAIWQFFTRKKGGQEPIKPQAAPATPAVKEENKPAETSPPVVSATVSSQETATPPAVEAVVESAKKEEKVSSSTDSQKGTSPVKEEEVSSEVPLEIPKKQEQSTVTEEETVAEETPATKEPTKGGTA